MEPDLTRAAEREQACLAMYTVSIRIGKVLVNLDCSAKYCTKAVKQMFPLIANGHIRLASHVALIFFYLIFDASTRCGNNAQLKNPFNLVTNSMVKIVTYAWTLRLLD